MDFGTAHEPDRYGRTDIFDVDIAMHSRFTCAGSDYAWSYVITQVKTVDKMI